MRIKSVTGWTVYEPKACICLDEWKDSPIVRCKSQACVPVRAYPLPLARLLERAARLVEEWNDIQNDYSAKSFHRESQWRHKLARWLADWRKAMEGKR